MPTTIIGVDFSGAKADNKTWIARGVLTNQGELLLKGTPYPIRREELYELLINVEPPAVVAMDFPFGVPNKFATHLSLYCGYLPGNIRDLWATVAAITFDDFERERDEFVDAHGELSRVWDRIHYPESISPLHKGGPSMIQMTYHGISLLQRLHQESCNRWQVPPLCPDEPNRDAVTLLEVMPGAALRSRCLPHQNYKNNKGRDPFNNLENRKHIIHNLSENFGIALPDLSQYRDLFIFNDDALDAYIASIVAALWQKDKTAFHRPEDHAANVLEAAQLEGCIYAPERRRD